MKRFLPILLLLTTSLAALPTAEARTVCYDSICCGYPDDPTGTPADIVVHIAGEGWLITCYFLDLLIGKKPWEIPGVILEEVCSRIHCG